MVGTVDEKMESNISDMILGDPQVNHGLWISASASLPDSYDPLAVAL